MYVHLETDKWFGAFATYFLSLQKNIHRIMICTTYFISRDLSISYSLPIISEFHPISIGCVVQKNFESQLNTWPQHK